MRCELFTVESVTPQYPSPNPPPRYQNLERWGRVQADVQPRSLRRGAWYRVLSAGVEEAVLDVHGTPTILARPIVEIIQERPDSWSIVFPEIGEWYLVCPGCAERVSGYDATPDQLRCSRCRETFAIGVERSNGAGNGGHGDGLARGPELEGHGEVSQ